MKKTARSPLTLCMLTAIILYAHAGQTAYGSNAYFQKSQSVTKSLIYYSQAIATVDGRPVTGSLGNGAAPKLTKGQLGELLLQAMQSGTRQGRIPEVRRLLRLGADPEYKPHKKALSPLDIVVQNGMLTLAKVFRQHGVKFNKRGSRGMTHLHQAAARGELPMVQFLVGLGMNPNSQTTKGWTPLHHAARFGKARTVLFLIRAGSNATLRNSDGFTPKELAINGRYHPVSRLFY